MGCAESRADPSELNLSLPVNQFDPARGESQIYRSPLAKDGLVSGCPRYKNCKNVSELIRAAFENYAEHDYLGQQDANGKYQFRKYKEIKVDCDKVGSAIVGNKLYAEDKQNNMKFVGLWGKNRTEWAITDLACYMYGIITLPVYDTLGIDACEHIFAQTNVETFIVGADKLKPFIDGVKKGKFTTLKTLICMDGDVEADLVSQAKEQGVKLLSWNDFLGLAQQGVQYPDIKPDEIALFCYTSGTTGVPKAAQQSHHGLLSWVGGFDEFPGLSYRDIGVGDYHLSYLPLAHIFERTLLVGFLSRGITTGFFRGDPTKLKDDMQALRPTFLVGVPRVFTRFADIIKNNLAKLTGVTKSLADSAFETKMNNLQTKGSYTHKLYDKLVMKKMKEVVGGRVKIIVSGAAPLPAEVGDFLKCAFACPIVEGYGSTETTSGVCIQTPDCYLSGHVGGLLSCVELKLEDVAEMNYTAKDKNANGEPTPRGEICFRGPCIMKGYYKDAEKTKEALDKDNWLHTGDIGVILPNGAVKIVDRKKNIFKLSQGEYVAPEKVENFYLLSKYVAEVFLYGDSYHNFCVLFAVPDKENLLALAKEKGISTDDYNQLLKNADIKKAVLGDVTSIGKSHDLKGFEQAKDIYLEAESFVT
eukprot:CAMPEP_0114586692 /NCGR_PEP_ID=MMETSP0125-20121206/9842_1 /TAXON_ID=485358 ORGANISM="Aristerostoma sp., Strain ATCC 50986" /NCGR_SAMPLE_ID=MMETSP0125 /ASSEMBLY_ACC=CAM_ASM_000245 /LENGTH=642 /DNA_ID=CAMNT_0001782237 /DNA_START=55 /DNA_END=1983 /DNA_ORIENTATION=-